MSHFDFSLAVQGADGRGGRHGGGGGLSRSPEATRDLAGDLTWPSGATAETPAQLPAVAFLAQIQSLGSLGLRKFLSLGHFSSKWEEEGSNVWINWMRFSPVSLKMAPVGDWPPRKSPQEKAGSERHFLLFECGVCEGRWCQPTKPLVLSPASAEHKS